MSVYLQTSSATSPPPPQKAGVPEIVRRSANYHPCVWGDHFLSYSSPDHAIPDSDTQKKIKVLKEEVRKILVAAAHDQPEQQLKLIDDIQRLGVAYHYEAEINEALMHINDIYHEFCGTKSQELKTVALCFRLLRQRGHNVSSDVFNNFKEESNGLFKESLSKDVEGLLSLYEAAHLRVHGEDILEEALAFTTSHLKYLIKTQLKNPLAAQVIHALKIPVWRSVNRAEARHYIPIYGEAESHNKTLLYFAKLDFNLLQKLHQSELANISRWWMNFNIKEKLPFARDRWVECYFWVLGLYFEPKYLLARRILIKIFALMVVLDDIYDVYGTLEEVTLFTDAIERWDVSALDQLPEYMRYFYGILMDFYAETEEELIRTGLPVYRVQYAKNALKQLTRSYLFEANCFYKGLVPKMEEYMEHGLVSAALTFLGTHSFMGLGDIVTKESLDWITAFPPIINAGCLFSRLTDDMIEHESEKETIDTASAVDCYMKQYGASKEDTFSEFHKQIVHAWKDINSDYLRQTAVPMPLVEIAFNMTRVTYLMYQDIDGFTTAETKTKEIITPVLVVPVPI